MARIRRVAVPLPCLAMLAACASAVGSGAATAAADATLRLVAAVHEHGGRVGIVVLDAGSGAVLAEHRATEGFLPASNGKILTAAVALQALGPEYRFTTELLHTGEVRDGVLHGDLILRGHGDPTLGTDASGDPGLVRFVAAVRAAGVQRVLGAVLGDGAWLGDEHLGAGWQWDHLREDFAVPFGGLCCRGNLLGGKPVADPARFAAEVFAEELHRAGIGTARPPAVLLPSATPPAEHALFVHESPPLSLLLQTMLQRSDNLHAEQLWRASARSATGDGSTAAAATFAKATLARLGVPLRDLECADGSGLSRRNLVQPMQVAQTLRALWRSPHRVVFVEALPLAGVSGTLCFRFATGPAHGRVRGKTGSIARTVALSGYVPRADAGAPPLVFAVLWNDFTGEDEKPKAIVDAFVQELAALAVGS